MRLIYQGRNGEFINGVPARDLNDGDIQEISEKWELSIAHTEGLLMKNKLYAMAPKSVAKAHEKKAED